MRTGQHDGGGRALEDVTEALVRSYPDCRMKLPFQVVAHSFCRFIVLEPSPRPRFEVASSLYLLVGCNALRADKGISRSGSDGEYCVTGITSNSFARLAKRNFARESSCNYEISSRPECARCNEIQWNQYGKQIGAVGTVIALDSSCTRNTLRATAGFFGMLKTQRRKPCRS